MAGAVVCALEVQISWQALHFEHLQFQVSWQAQHFMNLKVQISWQALRWVNLYNYEPRSADCVAGATFLWISRSLKRALDISGFQDLSLHLKTLLDLSGSRPLHLSTPSTSLDP